MPNKKRLIVPRQPYTLLITRQYKKMEIMKYGISHFYTCHVDSNNIGAVKIIPDGCIDIIFRCGNKKPEAMYVGTPTYTLLAKHLKIFKKGDTIFGVRFLQGNMPWMKNCIPSEILNTALNFADVSGQSEMIYRICSSSDFEEQIRIFMKYYLPEYNIVYNNMSQHHRVSNHIMEQILNSAGQVRIGDISEKLAFSVRYLNEIFRTEYGIPPKEYEKIVRFQNIITQLEILPHITDAAIEAGYYDQSHLLKEFRSIMGISPKEYLKTYNEIDKSKFIKLKFATEM